MKTAQFKYQIPNQSRVLYGTVTLKNDGKTSISLFHAGNYSYAERWGAKALANAIVKADFKHEAVTELKETNTKGLVAILTKETQFLKEKYIEETKKYAKQKFNEATKRKKWSEQQWIDKYPQKELYSNYGHPVNLRGKETGKIILSDYGQEARDEMYRITGLGFKKYEQQEVDYAEYHYERSIENLALRLNKKGIKDDTKMTIKTANIGVHITTTIEHEGTITKAWTIIASGAVQRPHYRYLIK